MNDKIKEVSILPIDISTATFDIVGSTPLLMDRMTEETLQGIQDKQTGKMKTGKKLRDIKKEIEEAIHYLPNKDVGFPSGGFKSAFIESTSFIGDKMFSKKLLKGIQIVNTINGLVPIKCKKKDILVHNVGSNTKHTPQFHDWTCKLKIQFDRNNISETDLATLINYAGFYYGVGIWSPRSKCGGEFGMYQISTKRK